MTCVIFTGTCHKDGDFMYHVMVDQWSEILLHLYRHVHFKGLQKMSYNLNIL